VPVLLNRSMGMDTVLASSVSAGLALTAIIAMPLGGWVTDRVSQHNPRNKLLVIVVTMLLASIFMAVGTYFVSLPVFAIGVFFTTAFVSAQLNAVQEIVPAYQRATAMGLYMLTGYILGGMWGPILMGAVSDAVNIQTSFLVISGIGFLSSFGYLWSSKYFNADYHRARDVDRAMGLLEAK
jgi:MFS family permease